MKRTICLLLAFCLLIALCACGGKSTAPENKEWTRQGYFSDEAENVLTVTWVEDIDEPGWYVGVMIGDFSSGWAVTQEGNTLHGDLNAWDDSAEPFVVTVSEEGEDGLLLTVEGGETYHFTPMDLPDATIFVSVNTEGRGNFEYAEGETAPEIDPEYPFQSAQINLAEPAAHTFVAWPDAGSEFVKWTKNGDDFSTEPQITVLLDESADFVAVFQEDPDWQNPVMNVVGEYMCDRAHGQIECFGYDEAWITIDWGSSAWELTRWIIVGRLDTETMTIHYSGSSKANLVYDESGEVKSEDTVYADGTGTIVFNADGSFTWHEDQSETGTDLVFELCVPETAQS